MYDLCDVMQDWFWNRDHYVGGGGVAPGTGLKDNGTGYGNGYGNYGGVDGMGCPPYTYIDEQISVIKGNGSGVGTILPGGLLMSRLV